MPTLVVLGYAGWLSLYLTAIDQTLVAVQLKEDEDTKVLTYYVSEVLQQA